jgi:hypothetical protein
MAKQNNIITYEQAAKLNKLTDVAVERQSQIEEVLQYYSKNTAAQLFAGELFFEAHELYTAFVAKDYSDFLFKKTDELYESFITNKPEMEKLREGAIKLASIASKNLK